MGTETGLIMGKEAEKETMKTEKKKHGFLKASIRIFSILLILALACGAVTTGYALYYRTHYTINFYHETSQKISANIRIAVIADIHNREYGDKNEVLMENGKRASAAGSETCLLTSSPSFSMF